MPEPLAGVTVSHEAELTACHAPLIVSWNVPVPAVTGRMALEGVRVAGDRDATAPACVTTKSWPLTVITAVRGVVELFAGNVKPIAPLPEPLLVVR